MATALQLPQTPDVAYFTNGAILGAGVTHVEDDAGLHIRGLKVFRTGLLFDSEGRQHDWTEEELDAAVENFRALSDELPNVPVRVGHTRNPHDLAGYYEAIRREGNFLVADILVTEPDIAAKVKRRTFRSRSIEIGAFRSQRHGLSWPVVLGLAFVDIPAVSGLYESPETGKTFTVITESGTMPDVKPPAQPVNDQTMFAAYYAQGLADGASAVTPPSFMCFGEALADPAKVQEHIAVLETFQRESIEGSRKNFVKSLIDNKVLLATQKDNFEALVLSMTPEQYEKFEKGYEGVGTNPVLGQFGGGNHSGDSADDTTDPVKDRISELEAVVRHHELAKVLSPEQISELASYKELQSLKGQKK
jgi:hypothetical protein